MGAATSVSGRGVSTHWAEEGSRQTRLIECCAHGADHPLGLPNVPHTMLTMGHAQAVACAVTKHLQLAPEGVRVEVVVRARLLAAALVGGVSAYVTWVRECDATGLTMR